MKKVVSVIIILCFLLNPTTSFGYSKPTLFKTKSHAQRYLQDEKPKAKDILKDPSILDVNKRYGKIMEWHKAKGDDKLIIHIQDRHVDETAQLNIASIIEELTQKYNVYLLSLEGASTELDTSFYDKFPDGDIKEKVSKFFVKKGIFTGSEFYKITHRNQYLRAIGAEDKELYLQHFDSYKENQIDKESLLSFIKAIRQVLNNLKDKAYSKHLKKLDLKSSKYRNKQIQLVDFAKTIADYAKKTKIELSNYPNVSSFLDLVEKEEKIDFAKAQEQREALIKQLSETLEKEQTKGLLEKSLAFKLSKITDKEFYAYLRSIIVDHQSPITNHKDLFAYIGYLEHSTSIDYLELFNEIDALEEKITAKLCKNNTQLKLSQCVKAAYLLEELYGLRLTNEKLEYINSHPGHFNIKGMQNFLKTNNTRYGLNISPKILNAHLDQKTFQQSIKFYEIALKRDIAIVENTLSNMKKHRKDKSILITGGFHTSGITHLLKEKDISYVVICPNIGEQDCDKIYADRIAGRALSVSSLVEFFKETLSPPMVTVEAGTDGAIDVQGEIIKRAKVAFATLCGLEEAEAVLKTQDSSWEPFSDEEEEKILARVCLALEENLSLNFQALQDIVHKVLADHRTNQAGTLLASAPATESMPEDDGISEEAVKSMPEAEETPEVSARADHDREILRLLAPVMEVIEYGDPSLVGAEDYGDLMEDLRTLFKGMGLYRCQALMREVNDLTRGKTQREIERDRKVSRRLAQIERELERIRQENEQQRSERTKALMEFATNLILNREIYNPDHDNNLLSAIGEMEGELSPYDFDTVHSKALALAEEHNLTEDQRGVLVSVSLLSMPAYIRAALRKEGTSGEAVKSMPEADADDALEQMRQVVKEWKNLLRTIASPKKTKELKSRIEHLLQVNPSSFGIVVDAVNEMDYGTGYKFVNANLLTLIDWCLKLVPGIVPNEEEFDVLMKKLEQSNGDYDKNILKTTGNFIRRNKKLFERFIQKQEIVFNFDAHIDTEPASEFDNMSGLRDYSNLHSLLFNRDNLHNLVNFLTLLRYMYDERFIRADSDITPPLQYGIKEGLIFNIGRNVWVCPNTESFRRHIIFITGISGNVKFAIEVKIPGDNEKKYLVERTNYGAALSLYKENPKKAPKPLFVIEEPNSRHRLYNRTVPFDKFPMRIVAFLYPSEEDGRRLGKHNVYPYINIEMLSEIAKEYGIPLKDLVFNIKEQVLELVRMAHSLGYVCSAKKANDLHAGNFRVVLDENWPRVVFAGDFGSFRRPKGFFARKKRMKKLQEEDTEVILSYLKHLDSYDFASIPSAPPAPSAGDTLKDIGDEDVEEVPREIIDDWRNKAVSVPVTKERIEGQPKDIKYIRVDNMPQGMSAYHFKDGNILIIATRDGLTRDVENEAEYHEKIEAYWIERGLDSKLAHRRAATEEVLAFGIDESGNLRLTPYHRQQLKDMVKNMAHEKLLRLLVEDRSEHHKLAIEYLRGEYGRRNAREKMEKIKRYEEKLQAEAKKTLGIEIKGEDEEKIEISDNLLKVVSIEEVTVTSANPIYITLAPGAGEFEVGLIINKGANGKYYLTENDINNPKLLELKEGETPIGRTEVGEEIQSRPELNPAISRKHILITRRGDKITIKDLGSMNGTNVQVSFPTKAASKDSTEIERRLRSLATTTSLEEIKGFIDNFLKNMHEFYPKRKGIVELNPALPVLVIPDIHARRQQLMELLLSPRGDGESYLEKLAKGKLQILILGDLRDTENEKRWLGIYEEYIKGKFEGETPHMDEEMADSFGAAAIAMLLEQSFPKNFHAIKGNHDNISNSIQNGNRPFAKFLRTKRGHESGEGDLIAMWVGKKFGRDFLSRYAEWEDRLPVFAIGRNFVASHTDPDMPYTREEIDERNDKVVLGLTWTQNWKDKYEPKPEPEQKRRPEEIDVYTTLQLNAIFGHKRDNKYYVVGHSAPRMTTGAGFVRNIKEEQLLAINNPIRLIAIYVEPTDDFNYRGVNFEEEWQAGAKGFPADGVKAMPEEPIGAIRDIVEGVFEEAFSRYEYYAEYRDIYEKKKDEIIARLTTLAASRPDLTYAEILAVIETTIVLAKGVDKFLEPRSIKLKGLRRRANRVRLEDAMENISHDITGEMTQETEALLKKLIVKKFMSGRELGYIPDMYFFIQELLDHHWDTLTQQEQITLLALVFNNIMVTKGTLKGIIPAFGPRLKGLFIKICGKVSANASKHAEEMFEFAKSSLIAEDSESVSARAAASTQAFENLRAELAKFGLYIVPGVFREDVIFKDFILGYIVKKQSYAVKIDGEEHKINVAFVRHLIRPLGTDQGLSGIGAMPAAVFCGERSTDTIKDALRTAERIRDPEFKNKGMLRLWQKQFDSLQIHPSTTEDYTTYLMAFEKRTIAEHELAHTVWHLLHSYYIPSPQLPEGIPDLESFKELVAYLGGLINGYALHGLSKTLGNVRDYVKHTEDAPDQPHGDALKFIVRNFAARVGIETDENLTNIKEIIDRLADLEEEEIRQYARDILKENIPDGKRILEAFDQASPYMPETTAKGFPAFNVTPYAAGLSEAYQAFKRIPPYNVYGDLPYQFGLFLDTTTLTEHDRETLQILSSMTTGSGRSKFIIATITDKGRDMLIDKWKLPPQNVMSLDDYLLKRNFDLSGFREDDTEGKIVAAAYAMKAEIGAKQPIGIVAGANIKHIGKLEDLIKKAGIKGTFASSQATPNIDVMLDGKTIDSDKVILFSVVFARLLEVFDEYMENPKGDFDILYILPPITEYNSEMIEEIKRAIELIASQA